MRDAKGSSTYSALKSQQYLSLTDIAYNVLLEGIINQDFKPGVPISIDNFAKQLNVSNTPVREALMRAHGQRLVSQKTNRGFVVSNILTASEIQQLFEVRQLLEVYALSEANISEAAVEAIASLVEEMDVSSDGMVYDDFRDFMALDQQFHQSLVNLAGNSFLLDTWKDLHVHLHLSRLYTGVGLFDRKESTNEHRGIVKALQNGDQQQAVSLLQQHIQRVAMSMRSFLEK